MDKLLHVLIIEDSEDDALLVLRELRRSYFQLAWERVQTAASLKTMLANWAWDVIISDYHLPGFDAPTALKIVHQSQRDIPFIVVSGTIGEQIAVDLMKAGAHDYLMKNNLARLPEAVRREIREARFRNERQQTQILLRRQQAAIEAAIDGIAILQNGIYIYANPAHLQLFGYDSTQDILGNTWRLSYTHAEAERFEQEILPALECSGAWQGEAIATRKDGSTFIQGISLTLTDEGLLISVCRDISDLKQAREMLTYNTLHDLLTDLPNRKLLTERLELAINRAGRNDEYRYAILFLDLNRFKVVNDSLGHSIGDQLLIAIAQRLKECLRDIDLVARLGGDEFVILLEDINHELETVIQVTERILADFQTPFIISQYEIFTNFSIGIVIGNKDYQEASNIIRDADIAMYQAKREGKSSYKFFDAAMHDKVLRRLTIENDLRKALENEEFLLHYQPIVNLANHQLIGFETLLRWQHPTKGLILPDEFIPIAEETGLIIFIDNWVFAQALQQIATWQRIFPYWFPLKVSINLSIKDLHKKSFIQDIDSTLENTGLDGSLIVVEITESILIENINETIRLLTQLQFRNIQISIDDFGTGYSSLQYLHRLPVNNLKIDRSFVSQMEPDNRNYQVVDTILTLSNQLGLTVVAEGIETHQQVQQLQQLGCQLGQGNWYSQPLTAQSIEAKFFRRD